MRFLADRIWTAFHRKCIKIAGGILQIQVFGAIGSF